MTAQPSNNGYTRCSECAHVYDSLTKSCPNCGKLNPAYMVTEDNTGNSYISEAVFNLLD